MLFNTIKNPSGPYRLAMQKVETRFLKRALLKSKGNRAEAARYLGINRTTLVEILRRRQDLAFIGKAAN